MCQEVPAILQILIAFAMIFFGMFLGMLMVHEFPKFKRLIVWFQKTM